MKLRRMNGDDAQLQCWLTSVTYSADINRSVEAIVADVQARGDQALLEYTNHFDKCEARIEDLEISADELRGAQETIPGELRKALQYAVDRLREYHEKQISASWQYEDEHGNKLGQQIRALDSVGIYVPGGKAAYPSSVLMNTVPAKIAGVDKVVMVTPQPKGEKDTAVLAAASIAGVDRMFAVGGAQAIAALAYGTRLIPRVDKIVGPGNAYVTAAKKQVFGTVGIDMVAGPSEVLIVSDGESDPDWVAMDMFAQSEHDEDARAVLICTDENFIDAVEESISRLLPQMERRKIIERSLATHGALILVENIDQALELVNEFAPEHLQLCVSEPESLLPGIRHAGAIFAGRYAAEVLGDYCAGPNHVLPTSGSARFFSPLGVYDFQKRSSVLVCTAASTKALAESASTLARSEGLTAHARSAEYRLKA